MIRKEAWPFYRTISGVRLYWVLEEPKGPKGRKGEVFAFVGRDQNLKDRARRGAIKAVSSQKSHANSLFGHAVAGVKRRVHRDW